MGTRRYLCWQGVRIARTDDEFVLNHCPLDAMYDVINTVNKQCSLLVRMYSAARPKRPIRSSYSPSPLHVHICVPCFLLRNHQYATKHQANWF